MPRSEQASSGGRDPGDRAGADSGDRAGADPFDTAALRSAVLAGWTASPARFREDANAEEALALGGYADRVLVELLANAVDAARAVGEPGRVRIRLVDGELRVANTGAPLTAAGVQALATLRASAKRDDAVAVGHFGIGFTAVVTVTDAPMVLSTTGGIRFDRARTAAALRHAGAVALTAELDRRLEAVPALRLPFVAEGGLDPIPEGYVTEVRLPLRSADLAADLLAELGGPVEQLFWALPGLVELDLPDRMIERADLPDTIVELRSSGASEGVVSVDRYRVISRSGSFDAADLAGRPVEERGRHTWTVTWALPLPSGAAELDASDAAGTGASGTVRPDATGAAGRDATRPGVTGAVEPGAPLPIGAPTPTDDLLGLPARLVGAFPVDDTRRRIVEGPLTDHLIDAAVETYLELVLATADGDRLALVPPAGFPHGRMDAALRERITEELGGRPVLRSIAGESVEPRMAVVLPGPPTLSTLLADAVPALIADPGSAAGLDALRRLGARTLGIAEAVAALTGIRRPPAFWFQLYGALDGVPADALAGLPVPLADGRQVIGPRGRLLPEPGSQVLAVARHLPGLALVDPAAVHPLLVRLGAVPADPSTVLAAPELAAELRRRLDDPDGYLDSDPDGYLDGYIDAGPDREGVDVDPGHEPDGGAADPDAGGGEPDRGSGRYAFAIAVGDLVAAGGRPPDDRLAGLLLTDIDDEPCPAGELRLPDAALADLVDPDAFGVIADSWLRRWPREVLLSLGVRDGFRVVSALDPDGALADLADVDRWWTDVVGDRPPPNDPVGVADLDLVADGAWTATLQVLAADRETRAALRSGEVTPTYTAWWLARFATIDGRPLSTFRLAAADDLAGLYDPLPLDLDVEIATALGVRTGLAQALADDLGGVLVRFADPLRTVAPASVPRLTAHLVDALGQADASGRAQTSGGADRWGGTGVGGADGSAGADELPATVRVLTGGVAAPADVVVPDGPWWAQVLPPEAVVAPGEDAAVTAAVLDLDLASELHHTEIVCGEKIPAHHWESAADRATQILGVVAPELTVVDELALRLDGDDVPVRWWVASDGRVLADDSPEGLGRAIAWCAGRWSMREITVAAARSDPQALIENAWHS